MIRLPMPRKSLSSSALLTFWLLSHPGLAQGNPAVPHPDPRTAAQKRLQAALQKCSTLDHMRFAVTWSDALQRPQPVKPAARPAAGPPPPPAAEAPAVPPPPGGTGSWHGSLLHVAFHGPTQDEILRDGGNLIARQQNLGWRPRHDRYADGHKVDFLPDPKRLLQALLELELQVKHRDTGLLDERPVEFLALEPNQEQVAELLWRGLLPSVVASQPAANGNVFQLLLAQQGGAPRLPATPPKGTVEIAIALDPATSLIRQVHFRSYHDPKAPQLVMAGGGAIQIQLEATETDGEDKSPDASENQPATYERGLLQRPRQKLWARDYIVTFAEHGEAKPPELDADAKRLLHRQ